MAPVYKVHYFDIHGRAEPIRWLLTYGNLKYEDVRYSSEDWAKFKPSTPLGQMPCLEVDGKIINQSTPICRYLGKIVGLGGKDEWENLLIDVAVENLGDLHKKIMEMAFEGDAAKKKTMEEDLVKKDLPFFLGKFDETAKKNGGYFALNRLTWADFMFTCAYETYKNVITPDVWSKYPNLLKVKDNVLKIQTLQDWIKKRPANKMFSKFDLKEEL
ncbi:unnamed protein product [Callosobruchus maculatus]|uniref:glutathione transferase n=1 Tax=Callosobruchus maculatus TaxID=64391 RepID=A0A653D981_CALMS|nr:unnamed protein product [Callosobruchus maculatus]